jgi:hypothetical protein
MANRLLLAFSLGRAAFGLPALPRSPTQVRPILRRLAAALIALRLLRACDKDVAVPRNPGTWRARKKRSVAGLGRHWAEMKRIDAE